ncbi:hypothetical protein [Mesorhizobium sp. L-8-10]|nr:hypothetical protein [Mesorhizobium sp. L-8-10]
MPRPIALQGLTRSGRASPVASLIAPTAAFKSVSVALEKVAIISG